MDKNQLQQNYPSVYEQIKNEGRQEAGGNNVEAVKKQAQNEVIQATRVILGEESAQALQQAINTGMSADQLEKAKSLFGQAGGGENPGTANQILQNLLDSSGHSGLETSSPRGDHDSPLMENAKSRAQANNTGEQAENESGQGDRPQGEENPLTKNAKERNNGGVDDGQQGE